MSPRATPRKMPPRAAAPSTAICNPPPAGIAIGYARVSTEDQKLDLQHDALVRAGVDPSRIYDEHVSGAKTHRPALDACLKALRPGDVLVVWKLDRLGRRLSELIRIALELEARGIGLHSLSERIDTTTAGGRMIFHVMGAFAQFERDLISERTKAGLAAARARGHRGGRKPKLDPAKLKAINAMLSDDRVTMAEVADTFRVCQATIYRALKKERDDAAARGKTLPPPRAGSTRVCLD